MDATDFKSDDPRFGNINQVRIQVTDGGDWLWNITSTIHYQVSPSDLSQMTQLSRPLLEKANYWAERSRDKYITKYIGKAGVSPGQYRLNTDSDSPLLIKVGDSQPQQR